MPDSLHIAITIHEDFLECLITGEDSAENTLAYWMQVLAASHKHSIKNLLVIEELHGQLKTSESYTLVDEHSKDFWGKRIAFIDKVPGDERANDFGLTMAQNRGVDIKSFNEKDKAIEWLLEK